MTANIPRSAWITGATEGLGMALVAHLLLQGYRVAASVRHADSLGDLAKRYSSRLLLLPGALHQEDQAVDAAREIARKWGGLDTLIINAGTCDYLPHDVDDNELLEALVTTNRAASEYCLDNAIPLLDKGKSAQVMAILSRHSARQLGAQDEPASLGNDLAQWFRDRQGLVKERGISLTLVAPRPLTVPASPTKAVPQEWTPDSAARKILEYLPQRPAELVLEAMSVSSLWPLPR
ncbi:SDR family NAD(P)-dependent oxidoreductase [Pseudomonas capeferrum]|uniref:SDR family NAD(P)-dependent oxidoreductase n=1 Tax=Pseudomonas capeferrum TaxID=1495066 RepID=UPI0015E36517|nr:SDR family NAD(P)-dependent oxidoreductase [Pseudomonas capeferrum]MBA1201965.1 SDR family NAD(P)-dependent oxidoreductase [Pseudomonas capeferrum]